MSEEKDKSNQKRRKKRANKHVKLEEIITNDMNEINQEGNGQLSQEEFMESLKKKSVKNTQTEIEMPIDSCSKQNNYLRSKKSRNVSNIDINNPKIITMTNENLKSRKGRKRVLDKKQLCSCLKKWLMKNTGNDRLTCLNCLIGFETENHLEVHLDLNEICLNHYCMASRDCKRFPTASAPDEYRIKRHMTTKQNADVSKLIDCEVNCWDEKIKNKMHNYNHNTYYQCY